MVTFSDSGAYTWNTTHRETSRRTKYIDMCTDMERCMPGRNTYSRTSQITLCGKLSCVLFDGRDWRDCPAVIAPGLISIAVRNHS